MATVTTSRTRGPVAPGAARWAPFRRMLEEQRAECVRQRGLALRDTVGSGPDPVAMACSAPPEPHSPFPEEFAVLPPVDVVSPHPEPFLAVDARPRGARHVVLDVVGQVDAFTAPLLRACLGTQLSRPGLRELVVDVGGVDFLGAAGVSAIAEAARRCRERGLRLRLRAHGRTNVLRPLELAGALDDLELEAGVADARRLAESVAHA